MLPANQRGPVTMLDILDRVLDKGIVIDAWVDISVAGIDLLTVEARVVIASIETYLVTAEQIAGLKPMARPALRGIVS